MRLSVLNLLLLTIVAIASSEERHKRHIPILMKWIKSALFGPEDTIIEEVAVPPSRPEYEVFRLPGHDDVVVKVSPKILNAEGVVYREVEPVNLKAFGAVVGIESQDDTMAAVREVDNLLSSGILYGGYDDVMKDHIIAMFPGIRTIDEEIVPVIESRPIISEVITPSEEEVELEVPLDKDSYEQLNDHKQAKIITADTKPGTELVETITNNELPNGITRRIGAAVLLGADSSGYERVEEVNPAPVVEISYPSLGDPLIENQLHEKMLKGFKRVTELERSTPLLVSQKHADSLKPVDFEEAEVTLSKDDGNSENEKLTAFTNIGKEVNISETLGPIPSLYLERMNYTDSLKNEQLKSIIIAPTKESIASQRVENSNLPSNSLQLLKSKVINPHPLFFSLHPVHFEDVQVNVSKDTINSKNEDLSPYTNTGKKMDLSHTLGPIPYPYSKHLEITDNLETNDQPKPVVIAPFKEFSQSQFAKNVVVALENSETKINKESNQEKADQEAQSEKNIPSSPIEIAKAPAKSKSAHKKEDDEVRVQKQTTTSKPEANISEEKDNGYVYVNHPNSTKENLAKQSDVLKTNVKTNSNDNLEVVAPVKLELDKTDVTQSKHKPDEKVPERKRVVVPVVSSTNPLKTNEVKPLAQNPVIDLNNVRNNKDDHQEHSKITKPRIKTSSHQQKQVDDSSINVKAHKDDISVDFKGRGDIPEK